MSFKTSSSSTIYFARNNEIYTVHITNPSNSKISSALFWLAIKRVLRFKTRILDTIVGSIIEAESNQEQMALITQRGRD